MQIFRARSSRRRSRARERASARLARQVLRSIACAEKVTCAEFCVPLGYVATWSVRAILSGGLNCLQCVLSLWRVANLPRSNLPDFCEQSLAPETAARKLNEEGGWKSWMRE